jgi:hypothetical protein
MCGNMKSVQRHCSEKQLHRRLAKFDFMYSNRVKLGVDDAERADRAVRQIEGKRLTYRRTRGAPIRSRKRDAAAVLMLLHS